VVKGHGIAVRDKVMHGRKGALINNENITGKEFGRNDSCGKTSKTLTNVERDNYNKERRFIFACE